VTSPWMVDIHTHLFPDWMERDRWKYAEKDRVFKEIYGNEKARMVSKDEMIQAMDKEGVAVSVVFGFPWEDQGINREHNDYILEAASHHPDRLVPFACLNPLAPNAVDEVLRCVDRGAKGVGEMAFYDRAIDDEVMEHLRPLMEILKEAGLPLLIHTNEPVGHRYPGKSMKNLTEIELLVRNFPENIIILAHWGGGILFFELMKEIKALFQNVYYDTAASPFLYQPKIFSVAGELVGFDRILLGTDYPLIPPTRYLKQISEVIKDEEKVHAICRDNARRLLRLSS